MFEPLATRRVMVSGRTGLADAKPREKQLGNHGDAAADCGHRQDRHDGKGEVVSLVELRRPFDEPGEHKSRLHGGYKESGRIRIRAYSTRAENDGLHSDQDGVASS
jgi:hypothetical protein